MQIEDQKQTKGLPKRHFATQSVETSAVADADNRVQQERKYTEYKKRRRQWQVQADRKREQHLGLRKFGLMVASSAMPFLIKVGKTASCSCAAKTPALLLPLVIGAVALGAFYLAYRFFVG
ncbi:hypothetical protein [Gilvimarinus chinensis]|uniref:hypothetical protein n=1 Tax=Gilvimarinus chinensis TaxID=396005 RepID=UPI00037A791D|nr:hypothetical protein [Gilvimarinus chinensis]